ncbi:MAG: hypothetical protein ACQEWF_12105 [Bacillota bacterium]
MKSKFFSFAVVCLLALVTAVPTLAASNSFSFSMSYRVVDGSANGQFHNLKSGSAKINGSHRIFSSDSGAVGPNTVYYQLYNKTSGNSFGVVSSTPTKDGLLKNFSGTYSGLGGGTSYYLLIYKQADDGRNVKGSGTVSN